MLEAVAESNRMEALKQLALSKYFRDYLGFDFSSYSGVGLHFLSLQHGVCLRDLLARPGGTLSEGHSLFRYWSREILIGMRDYLYQCCQELTEDLTLEHVFVSQEGLQIFFRDVPFGDQRGMLYEEVPEYGPRNKWRNAFVVVENRLITMYGNMLLEMLYGRQEVDSPIRTLQELSVHMRAIISLALNARDTLDYFMLSPGGKPVSQNTGSDTSGMQILAGGFVAAGVDEFVTGDDYKLWWLQDPPKPVLVLPNTERTFDDGDGGAALEQDWSSGDGRLRTVEDLKLSSLEWKPNASLFTIQGLLNHPGLQRSVDIKDIMSAWDAYYSFYLQDRTEQDRLERFLDNSIR